MGFFKKQIGRLTKFSKRRAMMKPKMRFEPIIIGLILVLPFWLWVSGAFGAAYYMRADGTAIAGSAQAWPCAAVGRHTRPRTAEGP